MRRQRGELVPIGEVVSGLDGPSHHAPNRGIRPGKHGPEKPDNQAHPSPFPRKQPRLPDRPAAVQGAKRRSEPLTARTDLQSSVASGSTGFETERSWQVSIIMSVLIDVS